MGLTPGDDDGEGLHDDVLRVRGEGLNGFIGRKRNAPELHEGSSYPWVSVA